MTVRLDDYLSLNRGGSPDDGNSGSYHVEQVETALKLLPVWDSVFASSSDQSLWQAGRTTEALMNQQANVYENYITVQITPRYSGFYTFSSNFHYSMNINTVRFKSRIAITGGALNVELDIDTAEFKDNTGASGQANRIDGGIIGALVAIGTESKLTGLFKDIYALEAGTTYTMTLSFASGLADQEAVIHRALSTIEWFSE